VEVPVYRFAARLFRAKQLQQLTHAYTGKKKRSVEAPAPRLLSKPEVEGTDFLPITQSTAKAFRATSSNGLRRF
jgi:hypothetical protein